MIEKVGEAVLPSLPGPWRVLRTSLLEWSSNVVLRSRLGYEFEQGRKREVAAREGLGEELQEGYTRFNLGGVLRANF